ncbi:MAG: DNA-3-methyladenine glycosylase I [Pseudomonadota bacterium]
MRSFEELFEITAERKGGRDALNKMLDKPKSAATLRKIPDDRWLAGMTKCIFQAGFNWKVVENMWPGFEAAFEEFDIGRCAMLNEDDLDRLVSDTRIVRYGAKIRSVQENAAFIIDLIKENGGAGKTIADWPSSDYASLLELLKKRGSRLGGTTSQYFLRRMGKDSYILTRDVVSRLMAENVIDKPPTSKKAMGQVQDAFNTWMDQSGRSLTEISRVVAMSL